MSRARATLTACEGDLPRSWATTVVFAVTTVMFLWNYVMFVVAAVMFLGNYIMPVAAAVMFLGNYHNVRGDYRNVPTVIMFLASAVLCQATALVLG